MRRKKLKPSVDILEGLSTGFNMDVSAPHLIHKWFTGHSRWSQSPLFMRKPTYRCCRPQRLNLSMRLYLPMRLYRK